MKSRNLLLIALAGGMLIAPGCVVDDNDGPIEEAGEAVDDAIDDTGDAIDDTF